LRIPVDSIPRAGRTIEVGLDLAWAREAAAEALELDPTSLVGSLELGAPQRGVVTVVVRLRAEAGATCDRCGEGFSLDVDTRADLSYAPAGEAREDDEVELEDDELELGWYDDGALDLAAVLQEAIALALPSRYTCPDAEGCDDRTRALLEASRAQDAAGHPGFSVLKDLT